MLLLWQLIDSGFPSGGYAHSGGLEAAAQNGFVRDAEDVRAFARQSLAHCGRSALPLVSAAHRAPGDLCDLDRLCDVFLSNPVANRASRAQGRALRSAVARAFPGFPGIPETEAAHYAPVLGAVMRGFGVPLQDTRRAFLFVTLRGICSAAVRLGLAGSYDAQRIQSELSEHIDGVIETFAHLGPRDIAQSAPLVEILQSTHDRLYSRLFQS